MTIAPLELPQLALAFFLGNTVLLLVSARELIVLAGDHAQPIIGQPAPLFSHAPAQLLPLAFEAIPVHDYLLGKGKLSIEAIILLAYWTFRTLSHIPGMASPANLDGGGIP